MSMWCTCLFSEMRFSWCRCPMQGCKCKVYPWWCQRTYLYHDANASLRRWRCKCLAVQMPSNGHVMIQMLLVGMSWYKCPLVGMPWRKCPFVGMSWRKCPLVGMRMFHWCMPWCKCLLGDIQWCKCPCRYAMMQMPPCGYILTWMLWCKHNLFKNSFYFQNEASTTPETKIFSNSIYYSWKVIFLLT